MTKRTWMRTWKRCWRSYESQPARRPKAARHSCSPSFPRRRESSGFALGRMEKSRVHGGAIRGKRSEEHTSELQSLMRISYAVFCLKQKKNNKTNKITPK